jgi:hypothetical protein
MNPAVEEYLRSIAPERKEVFQRLHDTILSNLAPEFDVVMSYGMIGYVLPHKVYPAGYHFDPKLPLPFVSIASQKSHMALYHMGMYAKPELLDWFVQTYTAVTGKKPDMGKSCIRFKKPESIPIPLIGELIGKMSASEWIALYEEQLKR